jgi:uncharacterized RDD family membrane protein YckC
VKAEACAMESTEYPNPYAPPSADLDPFAPAADEGAPLADRWSRLGAAFIDTLLGWSPLVLASIIVGGFMMAGTLKGSLSGGDRTPPDVLLEQLIPALAGFGVAILAALGIAIFQCYRIATTGQTLAKKWLHIKIVNTDGTPVTFGSGVGLRAILISFIVGIPYLGLIFWLIDVLMIFRDDRRCLHDLMAGTKVVAVPHD